MTNPTRFQFPFGRPVNPCAPSGDGARKVFILGAYPSALHVRWTPPSGFQPIAAVAVDNEPMPFWDGADQEALIESWKQRVEWQPAWGTVTPAKKLNGPSGAWVRESVLAPLGFSRDQAWITDCLDTYRGSNAQTRALADRYAPFAAKFGRPLHVLGKHPSENAIVAEATAHHRVRLRSELRTASPELLVTLGNAALRVAAGLVECAEGTPPMKLSPEGYGRKLAIRFEGRELTWLPLAHPAAPKPYQDAHRAWVTQR